MEKTLLKKQSSVMIFLFSMIYFVSYLTRINYSAVLLEIVRSEGISKDLASLALTGSAITYGVGQLISGFLGDKIKPYYLIAFGLLCAAVTNVLIPANPSAGYMTAVWCVNGFAQAMLWPPLVKIMAGMFDKNTYTRACVKVSWGSSFATIFVYLLTPVMIHISNWKSLFYFSAICGFIMAAVWIFVMHKNETGDVTDISKPTADLSKQKFTGKVIFILSLAMFAIILQGSLRDGVTNWMPTYISETFKLGSEISILTGVALPLFSIACFQLASYINRRLIKNEFLGSAVIFLSGFIGAAILAITGGSNVVVSVLMAALLTGAMHGVNFLLISILPSYFAKFGKLSFVSGLLNSCTYVGSALSTYGIALLSTRFGWTAIAWLWTAIALAGVLVCLFSTKLWNKFKKA